jgi:DNA-binding NarL/FixJ family response regulator
MNVLVVDGSDLIRSRLTDRLRSIPGVESVVATGTVREGFALLRSDRFGLAILELLLPDGSSSPMVDAMKQTSKGLVVAVLSNDADPVNRRLCKRAGVDWFFDKSLEFDKMLQLTAALACAGANETRSDGADSAIAVWSVG